MDNPVDIGPVISIDSYEDLKKKRNAKIIQKERAITEGEKMRKQADELDNQTKQAKVCFFVVLKCRKERTQQKTINR
mgnify:FL=1